MKASSGKPENRVVLRTALNAAEAIVLAQALDEAGIQAYVEEQGRKAGLDDSQSFDRALREALRGQAQKKGFGFRRVATPAAPQEPAAPAVGVKPDDC